MTARRTCQQNGSAASFGLVTVSMPHDLAGLATDVVPVPVIRMAWPPGVIRQSGGGRGARGRGGGGGGGGGRGGGGGGRGGGGKKGGGGGGGRGGAGKAERQHRAWY